MVVLRGADLNEQTSYSTMLTGLCPATQYIVRVSVQNNAATYGPSAAVTAVTQDGGRCARVCVCVVGGGGCNVCDCHYNCLARRYKVIHSVERFYVHVYAMFSFFVS